jgi:hypothetical protein
MKALENPVAAMNDVASNDGRKTRGRPFQPGNRLGRGRPAGSRNRATLILDALAEGEAEMLLRTVLEQAKDGDTRAAEMVLARVWPVRRGRPVTLSLPPIRGAVDVVAALGAVADAMAIGELTLEEASAAAGVIEANRRAVETADLDERLRRLEQTLGAAR